MSESKHSFDVVIYDSAGRLHIDEEMIEEVASVKNGKSDRDSACYRFNDWSRCCDCS